MKTAISLQAVTRTEAGRRVKKIRDAGKIPAILYGHKIKNQTLAVDKKDFEKVFSKAGESTLIELVVDSQKPRTVLVHDVQRHFLGNQFTHIDFYEVNMTEKIRSKIPIVFSGSAPAVKDLGGVLVKNLDEIEVESLPGDLPSNFEVDISKLKTFEDGFSVSDLKYDSDKVKILVKTDEIIVKVTPPRSEEELKGLEEKPVTEEVSAVEGVEKKEEEEASGPEAETAPQKS
ncbi:MAG: 50S ribosomal protein L25 [Patescibacteria group bacterium]